MSEMKTEGEQGSLGNKGNTRRWTRLSCDHASNSHMMLCVEPSIGEASVFRGQSKAPGGALIDETLSADA